MGGTGTGNLCYQRSGRSGNCCLTSRRPPDSYRLMGPKNKRLQQRAAASLAAKQTRLSQVSGLWAVLAAAHPRARASRSSNEPFEAVVVAVVVVRATRNP